MEGLKLDLTDILYEKTNGIAKITMNRPEVTMHFVEERFKN